MSLVEHISEFSPLLPLALFFIFLKQNKKKELRVIVFYILYSFINDVSIIIASQKDNALLVKYLSGIFTVAEYLFFISFFSLTIQNKTAKNILFFVSILFIAICGFNYLFNKSSIFDAIPAVTESIIIISYCIYYLFEQIKTPQLLFIYTSKNFWVVITFLIYVSITFFLFAYSATLSDQEINDYWFINLYSNIIKNILFAVALAIPAHQQNNNTFESQQYDIEF
jgi:hypothetical protein